MKAALTCASQIVNINKGFKYAFNVNIVHIRRSYSKQVRKWPRRVFSGIQPTGSIHLGNYFGAVKRWVEFQNEEDCIYSVVDLHSITLPQDPKELQQNIFCMTATLLACGIDPEKSILFQQSKVPEHTSLCWVLGCLTTMPRLAQLPQYKEKSATLKEIPLGLYLYPVLQAADILLYRATHVPAGEDQVQNLQLSHHLSRIFNNRFGETFPVPEALIEDSPISRIKNLRDPAKKMSKSECDPRSRIMITDSPEDILEKCKKALTDFTSEVTYEPEKRPGVANLITIHSLLTGQSPEEICAHCTGIDTGKYKLVLADVIQEKLKPFREKTEQLLAEPQYLDNVLSKGAERASEIAQHTWEDVKSRVGLEQIVPNKMAEKRIL